MTKDQAIYVLEMNNPFMGGEEQCNLSEALDIAMKAIEGKHYERAIFIPDGATNGDMIMAMFDVKVEDDFCKSIGIKLNDSNYVQFNKDWWNALYNAESEG
jgi:hypothetical protein